MVLFVCFYHSACTLTKVWQYLNSPPPPDTWLGGGAPLRIPFLLFTRCPYLPLKQMRRGQSNDRTWEGRKQNETKDCRVHSTLLSGVGTSRLPWPPGLPSPLDHRPPGKTAPMFARDYTFPLSNQFPARLLSTVPATCSSASYSGRRDAPESGPPFRSTSIDHHLAARIA